MQISAANLIAAQQAAQAALAAKQAAKAAPAFALTDFKPGPVKTAEPAAAPMPQAPQASPGARLGQHVDITV